MYSHSARQTCILYGAPCSDPSDRGEMVENRIFRRPQYWPLEGQVGSRLLVLVLVTTTAVAENSSGWRGGLEFSPATLGSTSE